MAETRAENSEMNIQRLNIRIDQIEDELIHEKMKIKGVSDDVDGTFKQMGIPWYFMPCRFIKEFKETKFYS